ncbi:hypothetical protein HAX54_016220, partial [Datura stramonium]|nr:hypothetical protein [Datura stramonium]
SKDRATTGETLQRNNQLNLYEIYTEGSTPASKTRGIQIAKLAASHQQQLQEYEQKVQAEVDQEQYQWTIEMGILNNCIVEYEECEVQMRQ